jgi:hypothetical protein
MEDCLQTVRVDYAGPYVPYPRPDQESVERLLAEERERQDRLAEYLREQASQQLNVPLLNYQRVEEHIKLTKAAEDKALELLMDNLDEGQQAMLKKDGSFIVVGQKTKRQYRIGKGISQNIQLLGKGDKPAECWCFHIQKCGIPTSDHMLAQKLMLEFEEETAIKLANKWPLGRDFQGSLCQE